MIGAVVLIVLVLHVAAHVFLVVKLRAHVPPARAALAFFVTPLAPYFGFRFGLQRASWVWLATLAAYAAMVGTVRGCV